MTTIFPQWYAVDRLEDETGISGTGIVAWCLELRHGVLMFWDTAIGSDPANPTDSVNWYSSLAKVNAIHGHGGRTVFRPFEHSLAGRGRQLMRESVGPWLHTVADLASVMPYV